MPSVRLKEAKKPKRPFFSRRVVILSVILLLLLFVIDISPFGGNIRFYAKWVECGQKPLSEVIELGFGAQIPSYREADALNAYRMQPEYFCTPLEAEQNGYSASSHTYDFPHLQKD